MSWLLLLFKSLFFNLCTRVCVSVHMCVSHIWLLHLICPPTGWSLIKWGILKLNLPVSEGNTAKEQPVTLEVNVYFTSCLSLPGSKENTEGVCADSASQEFFVHSGPEHHTAGTGQSCGAAEALCTCAGLEEQQSNWGGWRQIWAGKGEIPAYQYSEVHLALFIRQASRFIYDGKKKQLNIWKFMNSKHKCRRRIQKFSDQFFGFCYFSENSEF